MKIRSLLLSAAVVAAGTSFAPKAEAANDPLIGQLMIFGGNFCPRGYAGADGQLLAIAQNTALFSILGTTYGGDGRTTFALPDLRGRVPMHAGSGPGLTPRFLGARFGAETDTVRITDVPRHTHRAGISTVDGPSNSSTPVGNAFSKQRGNAYTSGQNPPVPGSGQGNKFMNPTTVFVEPTGVNGGATDTVNLMQPAQVLTYCVALQGIYPSRN